ncbi:MAG TPA: mevalonate kinase [Polyangiales bacterium]|nr:mevalonate kinase [Polyangiales bacterium]
MAAEGIGHGKIILLGEHSVVYGKPALAAALPRGCRATAVHADEASLTVEPWGVRVFAQRAEQDPEREQLRRAFQVISESYAVPLAVSARMEIPGSAGLGGSAALGVAMIRACDAAVGVSRDDAEIIALSLKSEGVFHGTPSGVDNAMATRGGVALYRKGQPLSMVAAQRGVALAVAHSGEPGMTKETVASVRRQHEQNPQKLDGMFEAIEALVLNAKTALENSELERLGQCMDLNQQLLSAMLVSTSKLEEMCQRARQSGALGAKLTGGGGGGCMIALARDAAHAREVVAMFRDRGHESFVVEVT